MIGIKMLYFDGCPSWKPALVNLKLALAAENISAKIDLVEIQSAEQAEEKRFLGSPSFLVNGVDLWPEVRSHYTLSCRVYQTLSGLKGVPSPEMLQKRLKEVIHGSGEAA